MGTSKKVSSIHQELNRFLVFVIIIFAILCAFIYGCVRRILIAHTNEYMEVSTRQMEYEMNSVYDKAENYLISMAADERVQKLFRESEREKAMDIDYVQKQPILENSEQTRWQNVCRMLFQSCILLWTGAGILKEKMALPV